jgi:pimeloyl-ACP methyl ester carboxylesterase
MTTTELPPSVANPREQSRAVYPDQTGHIERNGVRVFYEVYGRGDDTVLLAPTWSFVHSRKWKAQIGTLSRRYKVITIDPRGNGRSDRPSSRAEYAEKEFAHDLLDVMDATDTEKAVLVCISRGVQRSMLLAAEHPERVSGLVAIAPYFLGTLSFELLNRMGRATFDRPLSSAGKLKFNGPYIEGRYEDFVDWFTTQLFETDHSTKHLEDAGGVRPRDRRQGHCGELHR